VKSLSSKINSLIQYVSEHNFATRIAVLFDVSRSSHIKRLYVVDIHSREILMSCLAASGRGRTLWTRLFPRTSDVPNSWLTPIGHCLIAERYEGEFGVAYRLDGLDATNANARRRAIVLHSSPSIPDANFSFAPLWCSRGCVVVAPSAFSKIDDILKATSEALLWIYSD
jgi:hypothetical protein